MLSLLSLPVGVDYVAAPVTRGAFARTHECQRDRRKGKECPLSVPPLTRSSVKKTMLSILASSLALSPGAPKLGEHRLAAQAVASRAAFAMGPALTVAALPVHAEPLPALAALDAQQALPMTLLAEDGGVFGIVATVIVAGLGLFVLNFIKDAVFEYAPTCTSTPRLRGTDTRAHRHASPQGGQPGAGAG